MGTLRVNILGADGVARRMAIAAERLPEDVHDAQVDLGRRAKPIYAGHALRATGRLASGVVVKDHGGMVQVEAYAKDPATGYDYVGITRFGHKTARIVPNADLDQVGAGLVGRSRNRGNALAILLGGGTVFRRSSRGFHPASDWSGRALPQVKAEAARVAGLLGRKVASRL